MSGWVLAAVFVVGVSCWYLWKNREKKFALSSIKIAAWVGLAAALLSAWTGDGSGYQVAQKQPMKLAAMEGYYQGREGAGLVAFGILNPEKKTADDGKDAFLFRMEIPNLLSLLAERDSKAFVPGINDLLKGGYPLKDGTTALSAREKIEKGKTAIGAFSDYRKAKAAGNDAEAQVAAKVLKENVAYFGYGYIKDVNELVPNVPLTFYMFRVMVILGGYFILFFIAVLVLPIRKICRGCAGCIGWQCSPFRWDILPDRQAGWLPSAVVSLGPFRICCPPVRPSPNWMWVLFRPRSSSSSYCSPLC